MLLEEYQSYKGPDQKIIREINNGKYIKITKGIYETDPDTPGYLLANAIYGPSYLSFDFALSYHGLIPEAVYTYTSATFQKKKEKKYHTFFGNYTYRDIPPKAFPYEIVIVEENNYIYKIASAEKALCDKLYTMNPVNTKKEIVSLLFEDLRIDEIEFAKLDKNIICQLCELYHCKNLKLLKKIVRGEINETVIQEMVEAYKPKNL